MPIKLPKGFPRRKASGNALEELPNPPEPSFRVFERPGSKSFDGGETLKRMSLGRPLSAGHSLENNLFVDRTADSNPHNRGSGGTNNSSSSGGQNDNSSASARFSSSSTLPSSTDAPLDDKPLPSPRDSHDISIPPVPESNQTWRNKGRAFSFGRRKAESASMPAPVSQPDMVPPSSQEYRHLGRERALTESSYASGSTATPPKILDGDLGFGESDLDGFGSMFESIGKRTSQILGSKDTALPTTESPEVMSPASRNLTKSYFGERSMNSPPPLKIDRFREVESSPYSWGSHNSQDGLMSSTSPTAAGYNAGYDESPPVPRHGPPQTPSRKPVPDSTSPGRTRQQRPPSISGLGLRRSSAYMSRRDSAPYKDEDARLVMDSISASRRLNRSSTEQSSLTEDMGDTERAQYGKNRSNPPAAMFDSRDSDFHSSDWRIDSTETTPRAKKLEMVQPEEQGLFDDLQPTFARVAAPRREDQQLSKQAPQKKVMTPAQFERYRREQEMTRTKSDASRSQVSDEDSDNYDDDDETEHNRQLAKQRRKQEAHLAVYRQQMMKMTGEQPSDLPNIGTRPGTERASMSTPNLAERAGTPTFNVDKALGGKASDDEDEDIPLGILAAHGFPAKNRPPTAGTLGSGPIKYTSESYPPPPMSSAGTSAAGRPPGLPPFARNLPPDPYFGAGLVNPANREAPRNGGGSVYGASSPSVHPAGLVGVIAGEERAKAIRRGSPNAHAGWGSPLPQGMPQMPGMMSPGDEAQVQMSQQMSQMMQMQMQWMQQMQQMMAGGVQGQATGQLPPQLMLPQQQQMMSNGFLSPPGQLPRPVSHSAPASPGVVQAQQRAMSMMPSTSQWPGHVQRASAAPSMVGGQGYAPSIAPSERSNVGMPTRYRPVSIAPIDEQPRPSSRTSTMLQPPDNYRRSSTSPKLRVVQQPKKAPSDDDDDDEGWEEMKKKRENKKSTWKLKKKDNKGLQELYYPGT